MIARIGTALTDILKQGLADMLPKTGQIGLYQPDDRGEIVLGLYLYSIRDCPHVNAPAIALAARNIKQTPPRFLTLHYLITAYSSAQQPYKTQEEHRIIARAMEIFENTPLLTQSNLGFKVGKWVDSLRLEFVDIDAAEISQIWGMGEKNNRLSIAYKVSPVELSTQKIKMSQRVDSADVLFPDQQNQH